MRRRVLITGCGRSGTNYVAVLLRHCGLEVSHEKWMGNDGITSWLFGADASTVPWGPSPADYSFEHTFHLIRNPLSAIPSIATFRPSAWNYISSYVPFAATDSPMLRSARYWLHWNALVEKKTDLRLKIEEMPKAIAKVGDRLGVLLDIASIRQVPKDLNTRRYGDIFNLFESKCLEAGLVRNNTFLRSILAKRPSTYDDITWEELRALDPVLEEKIRSKAVDYGYAAPSAVHNRGW